MKRTCKEMCFDLWLKNKCKITAHTLFTGILWLKFIPHKKTGGEKITRSIEICFELGLTASLIGAIWVKCEPYGA